MQKDLENAHTRLPADARREQICTIAMRLFSERGFSGTTTKEIASAAGVSEATVFKHFSNKDELYTAILDHKACCEDTVRTLTNLTELIKAKDDFRIFYEMCLGILNHHVEDSDFLRLMLHSALEDHQLARNFFEGFITRIYALLTDYVKTRQADGVFREINPTVVVRAFIGMVIHHSLMNILWDKDRKLLRISNEQAARDFTEILMQGIKKI